MKYDYHVHSNYSDGAPLADMVTAARESGLRGIGFADHCNVSAEQIRTDGGFKHRLEFATLYQSYRERRRQIRSLDDRFDIEVFDSVEIDYIEDDFENIETFVTESGFDYVIGSLHYVDGIHFCNNDYFASKPINERRTLLKDHLRNLVGLVESELFDIAAHVDVFERYPAFRGLMGPTDYDPLIEALNRSRTVPEINVGRLFTDYADTNPRRSLAHHFVDSGVEFTYGSDAHSTDDLRKITAYMQAELAEEFEFVTLDL